MAGPPIYSPNSSVIQQSARLFLGAQNFGVSGAATLTRASKGIWYYAVAASQTVVFGAPLREFLRSYNKTVVNYALNTNVNAPLSLKSLTAYYLSSAVQPTTLTAGLTQVDFPATGVTTAPTVTDLLAATALTPTISANLYATTVTPANNALLPYNTSEIMAEINVVTPAGGTFRLYGVLLDVNYNI